MSHLKTAEYLPLPFVTPTGGTKRLHPRKLVRLGSIFGAQPARREELIYLAVPPAAAF